MKKFYNSILLLALPFLVFSQVLFEEGFDDIETLEVDGWIMTNMSDPLGSTNWFQGEEDVFPAWEGDPTSYIAANYNNTGSQGIISNWLITPPILAMDGDTFIFWSRVPDGSIWNDRLEIRMSDADGMTEPFDAWDEGTFTDLLLVINDDMDLSYPEVWTSFEITLDGIGTTPVMKNFAFRYNVDNSSGNESNFIGIDSFAFDGEGLMGVGDELNAEFSYYPSVVSDILNIKTEKEINSAVVFGLNGQKAMVVKTLKNGQLDMSSLPAGVYIVQIQLDGKTVKAFKVVKK